MSEAPCNVLFLCTGNSARSIIAESLLRHEGALRFRAFSAGSDPKGEIHPLAYAVLQERGYPTDGLRSKSWEEFACANAPEMQIIITVCDNAAGESCPVWPGRPVTAHWGVPDPAAAPGTAAEKLAAFRQALRTLASRVDHLTNLSASDLESDALPNRLRMIVAEDAPTDRGGKPAGTGSTGHRE